MGWDVRRTPQAPQTRGSGCQCSSGWPIFYQLRHAHGRGSVRLWINAGGTSWYSGHYIKSKRYSPCICRILQGIVQPAFCATEFWYIFRFVANFRLQLPGMLSVYGRLLSISVNLWCSYCAITSTCSPTWGKTGLPGPPLIIRSLFRWYTASNSRCITSRWTSMQMIRI